MNVARDTRTDTWISARIACQRTCRCFAALVVLTVISPVTAENPQETEASKNDASVAEGATDKIESKPAAKPSVKATTDWTSLPIAASLPDGRHLRPIGIYQSQMDELIPRHYRPVAIDRLNEAVKTLTDRATDDQASRLKGAVYWVEVANGTLVSDRSEIEIESDLSGEVRRSLGKVNLAIEYPQNRGNVSAIDLMPRLESETDGNLVAVFRGDDKVRTGIGFKWRLRGRAMGSGHEFEMRIPRTPQTRVVVSAPSSLSIEADDGVLRSQPNPPPDADATDPDLRWYEIDAGGLTSLRIRTRRNRSTSEGEKFVIRESSVRYEADPSGLTWTSPMVVQTPPSRRFPVLVVSGTAFTAVKVNGTDVPFTIKTIGGRERHLQIELPSGIVNPQSVSVNVTVTGHTTWSGQNGWCDLPMPIWMGEEVVYASAVDNVQLAVFDPLRVMSWELPGDWKQAQEEVVDDGVKVLSANGPPIALTTIDPGDSSTPLQAGRNWSRVRLIQRPLLNSSSTALKLDVVGDSLSATARVTVNIDPGRSEPLRMIVEPGWSLDSVSFVNSGRVIEHSTVKENSRAFVLWPEAEDANGSEIVIEAKGTRILSGNSAGLLIPPTWFLRTLGARGDFLAAIVPPADLNWSGDAAMQSGRIEFSELTDSEADIFGELDRDVLWFRPQSGRTPEISLEPPSVSFSSATVLRIQRDPDDDEVTEQLVVEIESPGQNLRELSIQTGPTAGKPPLQWSISGSKESPSTSVPSSDVIIGEGENDGIYTLDISDKNFRGRRLVARRRYPIQQQQKIQLPSIPGAASQRAEVLVGPGLLVKNKSRTVQMIPLSRNVQTDEARISNVSLGVDPPVLSRIQLGDSRGFVRLRYDAVEQPSITLSKTDVDPSVTIVWREQIRVIASSRGSDRIEATYKVSPTSPLEIEYEPEMQLAAVSRDGQPVDLITIPQRTGDIVLGNRRIALEPRLKTEIIRVVWNRSQFGSSWMRQCRIPQITVSGTILKSEYQLISSSDTFAPAALIRGQGSDGRFNSVDMRAGENATLVRRNIALAFGWMFAILAFALSWFIAERAPLVVAAMVVVLAAVVVLWWPWKLAVIGWLVVPVVAAAMLATSRAWSNQAIRAESTSDSNSGSHSSSKGSSTEFSLQPMARLIVLLFVQGSVFAGICAAVSPQDARSHVTTPQHRGRAVNVLVPVDRDGEFSGQMVYVPQSLHSQLFRTDNSTQPQEPRFQSARYRVKIDPATKKGDRLLGTTVEAEYLLHLEDRDRTTNLLRLPLAFQSVRRIELIDAVHGLIRFENSSGQVIATLPKGGDSFRLRVTLIPTVSESEQWTKLFLKIPLVAATELVVEAEQNLDAIRVGGKGGSLLEETDLRRWVEDLGPTDALEIDYRTVAGANRSASKPLQRRYWINAGKRQVTVDCEIDPPNVVATGESFQFIVRDAVDARMPSLTSPHWRLDGSEAYSSTRRLITVTSTRDSPGPVRLLWTQPSTLNFVDESVPLPIRIPEVIGAALAENAPAWVALQRDSALQFAPLTRDNTEPLSVDVFLAAWSGYRGGRIDRAFVALDEIPSPILQIQVVNPISVSQRHDLHVTPDRLELNYTAILSPNDSTATRCTLRLPRGFDLISVSANDQQLDSLPIRSRDFREVMLGSFLGSEPVTINVVAVQSLPENRRFSPPRLAILPAVPTQDLYTISRDRSVTLQTIEPALIEPVALEQRGTADSLTRGWIPVASWTMQSDEGSGQLGLYEAKARQIRFDCRQLITVDRDDTRWSMEVLIGFRSKRVPDFIDVEIPTRWCESLEVSPATAWSRQPATDPSRQIIRIRCDADELEGKPLSIRGHLQNSETARVTVPSVRVLGLGQRRVHINVPSQLGNEPIQWRTSAVEAVKLPDQWNRRQVAESQRSTYLAANPSWSMDLASLPEVNVEASAISCDIQVFANGDGALTMCHWDLLPGSLETIDIRLPIGSTCLGAWTAGQAVVVEPLESTQSATAEPGTVRVPLSLSRFSQTIELLIRVPVASAKRANYIPELIGIPVQQSWLTNYIPVDSIKKSQLESSLQSDRAIALARSVVDAVEAVSTVADRRRDEVAVWFEIWLARYQSIAAIAGHNVDFDSGTGSIDATWNVLDARMAPFVKHFSLADSGTPEAGHGYADAFNFGVAGFDGFVPERVTKLSAVNRPRTVQPVSSNDQGLRNLIVNLLTLIFVAGVLVILKPMQQLAIPVVVHPAFWLGLMGIFGFAVAPVPVAAAIVLVAVSLPVFPSRRQSAAGPTR